MTLSRFILSLLFVAMTIAIPATASADDYLCPMRCDSLSFVEPGSCPVCGMDLVSEHANDPKPALMPGLDRSFFIAGWIGLFLATLFGWRLGGRVPIADRRRPFRGIKRAPAWLTKLGRSRLVPFVFQFPVIVVFLFVIVVGLIGNQEPDRNIAPILTWNIWWMGLIFFAFFVGSGWCTVCPWMAIPDWCLNLAGRFRKATTGGRRWPKQLRNLYPAIGMFFLVTWLELAYDAPYRPALTAWMGIGLVAAATITLVLFERKTFCRYICAIGRATGAYGLTGMAAIRRSDHAICKTCETKDCYHGNEKGLGCPTFEFMGALNDNMYCTMCTECLKTCPEDNIEIQVRTPFADLFGSHRRRTDEAMLLLTIACITLFHGLAMVPFWSETLFVPAAEFAKHSLGDPGFITVYTALMIGFVALFVGAYAMTIAAVKFTSGNLSYRFRRFFVGFAYTTLPVSLAYHLAHNSLHFFYEGSKLVRLASDPFGWNWDLFGTADLPLTMLVPMPVLFAGQIGLLLVGHVAAVAAVGQISREMIGNRRQTKRARIVLTIFILAMSAVCLWLLHQPMEMRTG